jgi:hypothetical protein
MEMGPTLRQQSPKHVPVDTVLAEHTGQCPHGEIAIVEGHRITRNPSRSNAATTAADGKRGNLGKTHLKGGHQSGGGSRLRALLQVKLRGLLQVGEGFFNGVPLAHGAHFGTFSHMGAWKLEPV